MRKIRPRERIREVKRKRLLAFRDAALLCIILSWLVVTVALIHSGELVGFLAELMSVLGAFAIVTAVLVDRRIRSLGDE